MNITVPTNPVSVTVNDQNVTVTAPGTAVSVTASGGIGPQGPAGPSGTTSPATTTALGVVIIGSGGARSGAPTRLMPRRRRVIGLRLRHRCARRRRCGEAALPVAVPVPSGWGVLVRLGADAHNPAAPAGRL